ncbi:MAG TPA: ABC transporter ATP-binding protein [Phycisphaerales bacterium]|nr:ABC transporter ATP-binding protein [Phycisphaerales bacterium]
MHNEPSTPDRAGIDGPILRVEGLSVSFPASKGARDSSVRKHAVVDVSLDVHAGRTTAVVGESGSGKSVTALSILRLVRTPPARIEAGRVHYRRHDGGVVDLLSIPEKDVRAIRGGEIAMIFQEPMTSLNPVMRIGDQIIEAVRLHQRVSVKEARGLACRVLAEVGIRDAASRMNAYPHEFSGGMLQRVMIAIALSCEPSVLIADEPTTALDVTTQAQILSSLDSLKAQRGLGILLISHDLGLVANHADSIVVMYAGRVVEAGPVGVILNRPAHPYTRGLLAAAPRIGDQRDRLRTLDTFLGDPSMFRVESGRRVFEAWWPIGGEIEWRRDEHGGRGALLDLGSGHAVRVQDPGRLSTSCPPTSS